MHIEDMAMVSFIVCHDIIVLRTNSLRYYSELNLIIIRSEKYDCVVVMLLDYLESLLCYLQKLDCYF